MAGDLALAVRDGAAGDLRGPQRRRPRRLPHGHRAGRPRGARAELPAAPAGQAGEVPGAGAAGHRQAHPRRPGRQRPLRQARRVPRGRLPADRGAVRRSRLRGAQARGHHPGAGPGGDHGGGRRVDRVTRVTAGNAARGGAVEADRSAEASAPTSWEGSPPHGFDHLPGPAVQYRTGLDGVPRAQGRPYSRGGGRGSCSILRNEWDRFRCHPGS
ncbi:hypothetical protein SGPA1_11890 [Streptomyces misionensis JCM 4497]